MYNADISTYLTNCWPIYNADVNKSFIHLICKFFQFLVAFRKYGMFWIVKLVDKTDILPICVCQNRRIIMVLPWRLRNSCFRNDQSSANFDATETLNVHAPQRTIGLFYLSVNALLAITHVASVTNFQCNGGDGTGTATTMGTELCACSFSIFYQIIVLIPANERLEPCVVVCLGCKLQLN